jgi:UDP-glucuronate decarboxylase
MNSQTTAVVTGGLGFIGCHLVESLLEDDYHVIVLDNASSGRKQNLSDADGRLNIVEHDVRDQFPTVSDVDEVYHFASRASPKSFDKHPVSIALTNSNGTNRALEFAHSHGAKMILASSSAVYGDPERTPQSEDYNGNVALRNARAPYDESKRFSEALAEAYIRKHGLDVRTIRPFNVYGPRMRLTDGRVIPNFLRQAIKGEDITVHGEGSQTRSFCYVSDLVRGVRKLAALPPREERGLVVNLGGTTEISMGDLAEKVRDLVGSSSDIVHVPRPEGDPSRRKPDISRAKRRLDWSPDIDLETGLEQTLAEFRLRIDQQASASHGDSR